MLEQNIIYGKAIIFSFLENEMMFFWSLNGTASICSQVEVVLIVQVLIYITWRSTLKG